MTLPRPLADAIREARALGGTDREIARLCGRTLAEVRSVQDRVRTSDEFSAAEALSARLQPPRHTIRSLAWDVEQISNALDDQQRGCFAKPVAMAERMARNSAVFVARQNRVAPCNAVAVQLGCANEKNAQARAVQRAALRYVQAPRPVLRGLHQTLVDHGIAIAIVRWTTTKKGGFKIARLEEWPLEHVKYNESRDTLETNVQGAPAETINHGDGTWVVLRRVERRPWARDACITPIGLVWAAHTEGVSSWAGGARSHGQARMYGQLPEGITLATEDGTLSPDAENFLRLMQRLANGEDAAGIIPPGATLDFLANPSNAWQVFSELGISQEKAAARIYTGTDAALGSVGGAPGVDISMLFGVATTLVQGDFDAIESALNTGLYQPWTAVNYGESKLAPSVEWMLPDPDAERIRAEAEKNRTRFDAALKSYSDRGFVIDQPLVDRLAAEYNISPVPTLAPTRAGRIELAPTDIAEAGAAPAPAPEPTP